MAVTLSVPTDRAAPPKDVEVRPRQVKAWVDALPLAQSADSAKKMIVHLAALNRAKLDPDDRAQILEAYRGPAAVVLEELEAVYAKAPLPLAPRARDALALARSLAAGLALGHRLSIADRGGKLLAFGARKQLPLLVLRAMEYTAALLKASYKSYTPVPEGTWQDLHQLFLFAEQERVAAEIADADTKDAPINVYVECLLLALTDPYRLTPGEADKVVAQIRAARAPVTVGQARPATPSGAHFLVPCDTDKPPKPALSANDDAGGPNWRLLDANAIVDRLRTKVQAVRSGNVSATTRGLMPPETIALVESLVMLWGDPPKRAHRRNPSDGTVAICTGIKAIAHFLAREAEDASREEGMRKGITMPMRPAEIDDEDRMVPIYEYDVVNESEGGLKVRRLAATAQSLAVGEVIGVKQPGKAHWAIAAVRWVTVFEEGGMEFGLQFLAPRARVVIVTPTIAASGTQPRQSLLLAHEGAELFDESLLTPTGTYSELREFELLVGTHPQHVRARALMEKTARFELFRVSPS